MRITSEKLGSATLMVARARGPALSGGCLIAGSSRPVPLTSVTIDPPMGHELVVPPFVNTPDGSTISSVKKTCCILVFM